MNRSIKFVQNVSFEKALYAKEGKLNLLNKYGLAERNIALI